MTLIDRLRDLLGSAAPAEQHPVLWLGEPGADDPDRVGGKAANLSLLADRWPVPPGFCLPAEVHHRVRDGGASAGDVRRWVASAYRRLAGGRFRRLPVAVRSSAVDEDSAGASFAGQHDTVLNAVGVRQVADAVRTCWASADSERARTYRASQGLTADSPMAVLVQELVDADVSAVVFSVDPVSGDRDRLMINASWGLGEAVVAGEVTPDTYVLSRQDLSIDEQHVADKDVAVVRARSGTRTVDVETSRRTQPSLSPDQCRELGRLALDLEQHVGWPVDVECCYRRGEVSLLQCRPITALDRS